MVKLTNKKDLAITFDDMIIPPSSTIQMSNEAWQELYGHKEIRECVALGYLEANVVAEKSTKKTSNKENE